MIDDKLLIELDYYPLEMTARKTGITEDDLILLAAQDKLNVCVLMPQNKSVTRFLADPDLYDKELPCCFLSLCKVPALTFENYLADNSTPLCIVKSCEEDGVYYQLTDDAPLKDMTLVVMAEDIKRLTASNAPKPITPLTGNRYIHKPPVIPPANYEKWRKADLWTVERGILLLLNAEVLPSRNTSTGRCNSDDEQRLYDDCMEKWAIAESSLTAGKLKRIGKSFPHFTSQVLPSDFIEWAKSKGYPIPEELNSFGILPHSEAELVIETKVPELSIHTIDEQLADLFDPVSVAALETMFPAKDEWKNWAERASRNKLIDARTGKAEFNPYKAGIWFLSKNKIQGWDMDKLNRKLAKNLPARSRDEKHLLTGDLD